MSRNCGSAILASDLYQNRFYCHIMLFRSSTTLNVKYGKIQVDVIFSAFPKSIGLKTYGVQSGFASQAKQQR